MLIIALIISGLGAWAATLSDAPSWVIALSLIMLHYCMAIIVVMQVVTKCHIEQGLKDKHYIAIPVNYEEEIADDDVMWDMRLQRWAKWRQVDSLPAIRHMLRESIGVGK